MDILYFIWFHPFKFLVAQNYALSLWLLYAFRKSMYVVIIKWIILQISNLDHFGWSHCLYFPYPCWLFLEICSVSILREGIKVFNYDLDFFVIRFSQCILQICYKFVTHIETIPQVTYNYEFPLFIFGNILNSYTSFCEYSACNPSIFICNPVVFYFFFFFFPTPPPSLFPVLLMLWGWLVYRPGCGAPTFSTVLFAGHVRSPCLHIRVALARVWLFELW